MKEGGTVHDVAFFCGVAVDSVVVALDFPVVVLISIATVPVTRDLLSAA
jgi:hypothetical protein